MTLIYSNDTAVMINILLKNVHVDSSVHDGTV